MCRQGFPWCQEIAAEAMMKMIDIQAWNYTAVYLLNMETIPPVLRYALGNSTTGILIILNLMRNLFEYVHPSFAK